jgi:hypothetical protein
MEPVVYENAAAANRPAELALTAGDLIGALIGADPSGAFSHTHHGGTAQLSISSDHRLQLPIGFDHPNRTIRAQKWSEPIGRRKSGQNRLEGGPGAHDSAEEDLERPRDESPASVGPDELIGVLADHRRHSRATAVTVVDEHG